MVLKQWQKAKVEKGDGIERTFLGGRERETVHPSYQARSYKRYLQSFNEALYQDSTIKLTSCAYLHNYIPARNNEPLLDPRYLTYIEDTPIFFQFNDREQAAKLKNDVSEGNGFDIAKSIEEGKIRASKKLVETVNSLFQGNEEVISASAAKHTILIKGGPGTGKSVIGLNLMNYLLTKESSIEYITPNQAFREILRKKIIGSSGFVEIRDLFKGSASYIDTPSSYFDVLVCDEAHRLKNQ